MKNGKLKGQHAIERAGERFGIVLKYRELAAMKQDVKKRYAAYIELSKRRCTLLATLPDGRACRVVYDPALDSIVTVLPGMYDKMPHRKTTMAYARRTKGRRDCPGAKLHDEEFEP